VNRSLYRGSPNYRQGFHAGALVAALLCFAIFSLAVTIGAAIGLHRL
jgi:hypothetical protein